jgi:TM2 domain-containing membrane protein YozV
LPPSINNRHFFLSYMIIIPVPCFFINWFSHGTDYFKVLNGVLDIFHFLLLEHESLLAPYCVTLCFR